MNIKAVSCICPEGGVGMEESLLMFWHSCLCKQKLRFARNWYANLPWQSCHAERILLCISHWEARTAYGETHGSTSIQHACSFSHYIVVCLEIVSFQWDLLVRRKTKKALELWVYKKDTWGCGEKAGVKKSFSSTQMGKRVQLALCCSLLCIQWYDC